MPPTFSVLTAVHNPEPEHLRDCLASVRAQSLEDYEHIVVDDGSTEEIRSMLEREAASDPRIRLVIRAERGGICAASGDALAAARGELIALLDHDDLLDPDALREMSQAIGSADVAYSDHDVVLPDGRRSSPYYKPDFSPEQLRNHNYVLHLVVARRSRVVEVGGFRPGFDGAQDHDLLLRLTERTGTAVHVPRILYHWRQAPDSVAADPTIKPWAFEAGRRAVAEHCDRVGISADVVTGGVPGTYRVERHLTGHPLVSVVIPTRGGSRRVWGVQRCFIVEAVRSLVERSSYPNIEFVVVHDAVTPDPVLAALRRVAGTALRLVEYDEPFNFSRKINVGVAASSGDLVLILNDDTELIEPDSIGVMAAHLEVDDVGMVGPKLLFADGTVQDGGHVYNGHLLPGLVGWHGDSPGPPQLRPLAVEREVSGVTAAAALVRRSVFDEVGGFDESMPVNFNDVDFSLKIRAAGRRVIWTPAASWYHFESQTRAPEASDEEFRRIDLRWHHEINHDPYYNPNLAPFRSDWLERPLRSGSPPVEPDESSGRWLRHLFTRQFTSTRGGVMTGRLWAASLLLVVTVGVLVWSQQQATTAAVGSVTLVRSAAVALVLVAVSTAALRRRRLVLAAGVLVAVAPSGLAQLTVMPRRALVLVAAVVIGVITGGLARRSAALAAAAVAAMVAVGLAVWWADTPVRYETETPSWTDLIGTIGSTVGRAVGSLGVDGASAPLTAVVAWWLAVALVVAPSLMLRRWVAVAAPAGGLVVLTIAALMIERWRGPVEPSGGIWLLAGCVAFAAGRVELPRRAEQRLAMVLAMSTGWAWFWSVAAQVRFVAIDAESPANWSRWRTWGSVTGSPTASALLPIVALAAVAVPVSFWLIRVRSGRPRGVNVVGYHTITAGLGERTRELVECLRAADVRVACFDLDVDSARESSRLPAPDHIYDTTIAVVPAFEMARAAEHHPELFEDSRVVAGYWFWELADVPDSHLAGLELVDEVWAPTSFVRDAYRPVTLKPVRLLPLPIPEPTAAASDRRQLGLDPDPFVFLVSFSHLSVMERKNPIGAIEAFRAAFPAGDPDADRFRLVIKTLNADLKPDDAARLAAAAAGDTRITVRDERLDHAELMALVREADVFVSLHRSEGLGLQIADAMWLGTPVLATGYSGSRDLIDHGWAAIVGFDLTGVRNGDGAYPDSSQWADPDLEHAAALMRRLARDRRYRERLADAARMRVGRQTSRTATGRQISRLLSSP